MPVSNLKYLPRLDCYKAQIGGQPRGSHATDYEFFGVMLTYGAINIGISPGHYKNLVAREIEKHRSEMDELGVVDNDEYWDYLMKQLMVNNLATYYIAREIVNCLRRIPKASLAEIRQAQTSACIFNNNHNIIIGVLLSSFQFF